MADLLGKEIRVDVDSIIDRLLEGEPTIFSYVVE